MYTYYIQVGSKLKTKTQKKKKPRHVDVAKKKTLYKAEKLFICSFSAIVVDMKRL